MDAVLDQLVRENLLNDGRFTEVYLRRRIEKGYGPVRLRQELRERGIDDALIETALDAVDVDWMEALRSVREKKFGPALPAGYREQAAESRFLQYRGYTMEQIRSLHERKQHDQ